MDNATATAAAAQAVLLIISMGIIVLGVGKVMDLSRRVTVIEHFAADLKKERAIALTRRQRGPWGTGLQPGQPFIEYSAPPPEHAPAMGDANDGLTPIYPDYEITGGGQADSWTIHPTDTDER